MKDYEVNPDNPVETLELIDAMIASWKAEHEIMENGKIDVGDIPIVWVTAPKLFKGFVGIKYVDNELAVITDAGKDKIKEKISEFVIAGDAELESLVEDTLEMLLTMVGLAKRYMSYLNKE